jgi:O-acetyl-ADP-ribose deacetylase (regulator of RNase III)
MGKGIALQFKKAFPDNFEAYKRECEAGRLEIGKVFIYQVGGITNPRYIINFPTKKHWRERSRIEFIREGLKSLVEAIRTYNISSIAIPPLGCGNGGLNWDEVRPLIEEAMAQVPNVRALVYKQAGTPPVEQMVNRTERPKLTPGRAAVLALMNRYLVPGYLYRLSLLELQKLAYFLQVAGEPLRLKYEAFRYGPYADNLRHVLNRLEGHYIPQDAS